MKDDTFDALCELEFTDAQSGKKVMARMGPPMFDPGVDWFCLSELTGTEKGKIERVYGVNPFQAIWLCFKRFRLILATLPGDFKCPTGIPPHIIFPREIPWGYGDDVYQRFCKFIDRDVQNIENKTTRRLDDWLGRQEN